MLQPLHVPRPMDAIDGALALCASVLSGDGASCAGNLREVVGSDTRVKTSVVGLHLLPYLKHLWSWDARYTRERVERVHALV